MQQLLIIKKLKKDSTIDSEMSESICDSLIRQKLLVFPVDAVYGLLCVFSSENLRKCEDLVKSAAIKNRPVIVTNFNMLEQTAAITKKEYDFLRRIWPDEINVILNGNTANGYSEKVETRIPRFQFILDILSQTSKPLLFFPLTGANGRTIFRKKDITDKFSSCTDSIIYLNEWSRTHVSPTVIDISSGSLEIVEKGKIALEEIQSLYFLDTSDGN
ncbi:MAG: Sua5/YciO/YrdC/YwlC family protein [Spirochaetes bacterium]|nr:Sua5/YciO/YrdC/YwlC family protein [Spirochaetota bacterium]